MLSIPERNCHKTKLADWLELTALASPDGRVGFGTLVSASNLGTDEEIEDIGEEDAREDGLVLATQDEIGARRKFIGPDYPFHLDDKGEYIELRAELSEAGVVYLFCLFLSHASDRTILPEALAPVLDNAVRNLFQSCATVAAAGYVEGVAISFGWPRPGGADFLRALHDVYALFGDGTPHAKLRPAAPVAVKDDGIDIIAWRPSVDRLPGMIYVVGQAASGINWEGKNVVADSNHFHAYWFERPPGSTHQCATFIPFCLDPKGADQDATEQEVLVDHMQNLASRFGVLFYRYRMAKLAADGLRVHKGGQHRVDGAVDLPHVREWVLAYSNKLRAAVSQ